MDAAVGPFMLARDASPLNWRDKSIMRTAMPLDDLPQVRAMVRSLTGEILDKLASGSIDVVNDLGRRVPVRLCGEYFGFPGPDESSMLRWSKATQADFFKNLARDPAIHSDSVQAGLEITTYLKTLLATARQSLSKSGTVSNPAILNTVVFRLLQTIFPNSLGFDDERLVANIVGLMVGSVETTSQAIVQSLDQILRRPSVQKAAVQSAKSDDDTTLDAIVWEALRFDPINPLVFRFVERDCIVASGTNRQSMLRAGSIVFACTASAMHDAGELPDPDLFVGGRPSHHYLHFGYGQHECLGKCVASMMIPEVIKQILRCQGIGLLPNGESVIDFAGGPFPEHYKIAFGGR